MSDYELWKVWEYAGVKPEACYGMSADGVFDMFWGYYYLENRSDTDVWCPDESTIRRSIALYFLKDMEA